jgi:hypothetical protein
LFHKRNNLKGANVMVKSIWKKFHTFMKAGRLNKVVKISGLK